jgi:hypothetical protein
MLIRERKMDKLQKIRFDTLALPLNGKSLWNSSLSLKLYEIAMGGRKFVKDFD